MTTQIRPIIIVACTRDFAIGRNGDLLYHISDDLKRFKSLTMGHPIIMGRRTFESFPKGALPGRRNIVISRNPAYAAPGIELVASLDAALDLCAQSDASPYIIGGGQIYAQALGLVDRIELTLIDAEIADADTIFPELTPQDWALADGSDFDVTTQQCELKDPRSGVNYAFLSLMRK